MQVLIKLDFQGGRLHFGGYDQGLSTDGATPNLLADTFFSALCHGWSCLYGDESLKDDFLENFISGKPPFLLSDLFPYKGKEILFPKPKSSEEDQSKQLDKKKLKKIQYLSAENLKFFLRGRDLKLDAPEFKSADIWQIEVCPQVSVSRKSDQDPNPYSVAYLSFGQDAGLWGLIEFKDKSFSSQIKQVIEFLGAEYGIGGKRSTGSGRFKLAWHEDPPELDRIFTQWKSTNPSAPSENFHLLLSIANPSDKDEAGIIKQSSYELINRKGFIYSKDRAWGEPVKKRAVCMIQAGSMLKNPIKGRLIDITPELKGRTPPHPVYRYGFALTREVQV